MNVRVLWKCLPLLLIFCLTQVCCGQAAKSSISKEQALKEVKVKAADGWKEAVSDKGRFRVLFPGDATATINASHTMPGFQLLGGDRNWFAYYVDYPNPATNDSQVREDYRQSIEAIARNKGNAVKRQGDVSLNGKLGFDAVIEGHGAKSFMRGFLVGHRFYSLEVDVRGNTDAGVETPEDVRQFFDSFTFWE